MTRFDLLYKGRVKTPHVMTKRTRYAKALVSITSFTFVFPVEVKNVISPLSLYHNIYNNIYSHALL